MILVFKRILSLFCFLILLLSGCSKSDNITEYKQVTDLAVVDSLVSTSEFNPKDILVIFDFNYTLTHPTVPCFHKDNIDAHKKIFKKILKRLSPEQIDLMLSQMKSTEAQELISNEFSTFFKKHLDVNFLVCSSSLEQNADDFLKFLNENNVIVRNGYNLENFSFLNFKEYLSGHPVYKNGVIVTNRAKKGDILIDFFKRISRKPKLIIFVDNSVKKLDDVKNALKTLPNTKLIIVEYCGYKNKKIPSVSEEEFTAYWSKKVEDFLKAQNN